MTEQDEPVITPEMIEQLKARDGRVAALDRAFDVEAELRASKTLALVRAVAKAEADDALEGLSRVSPTDTSAIIKLQAKIYCTRLVETTIRRIIEDGVRAAAELNETEAAAELNETQLEE